MVTIWPELLHLLTGTVCTPPDCDECRLQWLLTGNIYLTVQSDGAQDGAHAA